MKQLSPTEIWHLSAKALHDKSYRENYTNALAAIIADREAKIIDTACGSGFPAADLYEKGFKNIQATDANAASVQLLKEYFTKRHMPIPVSEGLWQELSEKIQKKFQVLVNADNSLVYADGWSGGEIVSGKDKVFERIVLVLKNFYSIVEDNGIAIIGLGKHYHQATTRYANSFELIKAGQHIHIEWNTVMDWETRNLKWITSVSGNDIQGTCVQKAYLITKDELMDLMKEAGFKATQLVEPENTRDNFIIGTK